MTPLLRVGHLSKTFPGVRALDDVSIEVGPGEVVALLGHNGSGKSTLIKVLAGIYPPDDGASVDLAPQASLHFIHQDLGLVPTLTALENLDLSRRLGAVAAIAPVARRAEHEHGRALVSRFGAHFDLTVPVAQLTPAERATVAIARALDDWTTSANVLVLDEPTAALHGREVDKLLDVVRQVADAGAGVVYVSHRLDEVVRLADRVVILRDGRVAATRLRGEYARDELVSIIADGATPTGSPAATPHPVTGSVSPAPRTGAGSRLTVHGLVSRGLNGIDLSIRAGEVVGVCGLVGSGMEHLGGAIFGARSRSAGQVLVDGTTLVPASPSAAIAAGVGYVPADRRGKGAVVNMNARENLTLPRIGRTRRSRWRLDLRGERRDSARWLHSTGVRPSSPERAFGLFSGGNQQKIVVAKWLRLAPGVLILDEPTQGVDVGAKAGIYELLNRAAAAGSAVLVMSSDAKELAGICERVIVLDRGQVAYELRRPELNEKRLVHAVLTGARTPGDPDACTALPAATASAATVGDRLL